MLRPRRRRYTADYSESESELKAPRGLRLSHNGKLDGDKLLRSSPIPWNIVVPTHRRERATEGLLLGSAVAEALSLPRHGLHPRVGLKLFGRNPLHYQFVPGVGTTNHRTHSLLMTFQAMLQSKATPSLFASNLRRRIAWYQRSFLLRHIYTHGKRLVTRMRKLPIADSVTVGLADDPLVRSLVMSIMLQGCADSGTTWFQSGIGVSHSDTRVLNASLLVAYAAQLAQMVDQQNIVPTEIVARLVAVTEDSEFRSVLMEMNDALVQNQSMATFAKQQGWANGLPNDVFAAAIIGIYAWLRHPKRFRNCVERTILLGGACSNAATIAGGLSGISLGRRGIPNEWVRNLSIYPHNSKWREGLIERVKDWPHGVDDIQSTAAMSSSFFGQLVRNGVFSGFRILHGMIRLPMRLSQFSVEKRL
jgi:ADP-ribosyl-[dinitrogen reductase] hydrolase